MHFAPTVFLFALFSTDTSLPPLEMGITVQQLDLRVNELQELKKKGLSRIRVDLWWSVSEPKTGQYDFTSWHKLVRRSDSAGIEINFILAYSNANHIQGNPRTPPRTPAQVRAYVKWCLAAVDTFQGRGIVWEIWNEPNWRTFWGGTPSAEEYARLASEAVKALKAVYPMERIQVGNFAGFDLAYLRGFLKHWSAPAPQLLGLHPYSSAEIAVRFFDSCRTILARHPGWDQVEIVSGEWGWSTYNKGSLEAAQSARLLEAIVALRRSKIRTGIWYSLADKSDLGGSEDGFGFSTSGCLTRRSSCLPKAVLRDSDWWLPLAQGPIRLERLAGGGRSVHFWSQTKDCAMIWRTSPSRDLADSLLPQIHCQDTSHAH